MVKIKRTKRKRTLDPYYMAEIGKIGGTKTAKKYGSKHFSAMAKARKNCKGGRPVGSKNKQKAGL